MTGLQSKATFDDPIFKIHNDEFQNSKSMTTLIEFMS